MLSPVEILYSSLMYEFQLLLLVFNILLNLDCISFHSYLCLHQQVKKTTKIFFIIVLLSTFLQEWLLTQVRFLLSVILIKIKNKLIYSQPNYYYFLCHNIENTCALNCILFATKAFSAFCPEGISKVQLNTSSCSELLLCW